jgi:branched-chain amino acid transport system substrate-binding protein
LFSASGVTAVVEQTQRAATLLAINQINAAGGVLGRLIEPVSYDPGSDPEKYRELAKRLCDEDKVKIIFGCKMSSARKAVLPIVEARDVLLFYPTPYEGFEYTQHCIYTGAAPNQNSVQLVEYLASHYGTKVFLLGSNYIYPHESNRVVGGLFKQMGGSVLDEMYFPLDVEKSELA